MIECRDLVKAFGPQTVLDGVSLRIDEGESVVIVGRSGEGKSVLLKHFAGLIAPDAGDVLVAGESLVGKNERALLEVRRALGMVFQQAALFDSMTVGENVGFVLNRERRLSRREIDDRVAEALDMVELAGVQAKKPAELSGGMRKRVGIARAIVYRPRIVLYDEPTTGLDPVVSDSIDQLIRKVNERLGVTTVVVTHDMRSARRLGQKAFMLHKARILAGGTGAEVFDSSDPTVRRFVDGVADDKEFHFQ